MRIFSPSVFILLLTTLGLAGCSLFSSEPPIIDEHYLNSAGVQVDLMQNTNTPDANATNYQAIAHRSSDGSVEIYSLDGVPGKDYAREPSPVLQRSSIINQTSEEPFVPESGLEIFPLDKKMNQALRLPK